MGYWYNKHRGTSKYCADCKKPDIKQYGLYYTMRNILMN